MMQLAHGGGVASGPGGRYLVAHASCAKTGLAAGGEWVEFEFCIKGASEIADVASRASCRAVHGLSQYVWATSPRV
jgi:hypothetical protein